MINTPHTLIGKVAHSRLRCTNNIKNANIIKTIGWQFDKQDWQSESHTCQRWRSLEVEIRKKVQVSQGTADGEHLRGLGVDPNPCPCHDLYLLNPDLGHRSLSSSLRRSFRSRHQIQTVLASACHPGAARSRWLSDDHGRGREVRNHLWNRLADCQDRGIPGPAFEGRRSWCRGQGLDRSCLPCLGDESQNLWHRDQSSL